MSMKLPIVKWRHTGGELLTPECDGGDDFVFRYAKYCLRVEQMDNHYWWWCIYYGDDYIEFDEPRASTSEQAMDYAMAGFYSRLISRKS